MQIELLAIDTNQPFGNTHDAFNSSNRRQARPFKQSDGIEDGFSVKNPAAGVIALSAIEATTPALVRGKAKRGKAFFLPVVVRMPDPCG